MNHNTITFLGLEGTCIKSWSDPTVINTEKLRPWIKGQKIGIFALSIQTDEDRALFTKTIKPSIEGAFGVSVEYIIGAPDVLELLQKKAGVAFKNVAELAILLGKETTFLAYIKSYPIPGISSYVLFDDAVQNSHHTYYREEGRRTVAKLINIDEGPIWTERFS